MDLIESSATAREAFRIQDVSWRQSEQISRALGRRSAHVAQTHTARARKWIERAEQLVLDARAADQTSWSDFATDAWQRAVLALDTLRERGDNDAAHEQAGTPPVLIYDSEVVVDGRTLKRPVNYVLLKILPPPGVEVLDWKRPYMIIDPRAGHGAGIGGFKQDSQVGVALRDGHPVYFVAFRPHPEPGQTIADVSRAEAEFVKEIGRLHPRSPKPIIVGNCQGGWATMLLAATNPDITGPLVINGAPIAYWSGPLGDAPMRYNGGLLGGVLPALVLSDLGGGEFDGAHLVSNFEQLNPGRNIFRKYFDLYDNVDTSRESFLEFERWWGGFHFMNEAEIRWIVEQLFVGNRLARGEARMERGRHLDLKQIRSPIIVFASHGDNITPPQQALNWIADTYADENEIKIRGQRIIYMVHEKVGHLGIFVSSSIAKKEHTEVASTLKTIEALAPGLYEMVIEQQIGEGVDARFLVSFQERKLTDIHAFDDANRDEERGFAAVDRLSQLGSEIYDLTLRPWVRAMVTPPMAKAAMAMHPMRVQRAALSSRNPAMAGVAAAAARATAERRPLAADNWFRSVERLWADGIEQTFDFYRDLRDSWYEATFLSIYSSPAMDRIADSHAFQRTRKDPAELRFLPEVQAILMHLDRGGFAEAVIRMLIILADARGSVRRSRLERSAKVLTHDEPFVSLGAEHRAALIHEQSIIVQFEPEQAIETLPRLLVAQEERDRAIGVVEYIVGAIEEMEPHTIRALQTFRAVLDLPRLEARAAGADPLAIGTDDGRPVDMDEAGIAEQTAAVAAAAHPLEAACEVAAEAASVPAAVAAGNGRARKARASASRA